MLPLPNDGWKDAEYSDYKDVWQETKMSRNEGEVLKNSEKLQ